MNTTKTESKLITLTNGGFAMVDAADFDALSAFEWHDHNGYACRWVAHPAFAGRRALVRMHRQIAGLDRTDARKVDHGNGCGLDNRRGNLRVATSMQNSANQACNASSTTGLKGASLCRARGCFQAKIRLNKTQIHLGYFRTAELAHAAYMAASREARGEFHNDCTPSPHWWDSLTFKKLRAGVRAGSKRIAALKRAPRTVANTEALTALWVAHNGTSAELARFVLSNTTQHAA
ncbi:hypothetical protein [Paraburkholderia sp. GAS348]|uniref:hypothetical protein n=1 Tax=Paraburkholderia sp. GAS348 TaxID=3035132 RepID=UPI003D2584DA